MNYVTVATLLLTGNKNFHFTALFKMKTCCNAEVTGSMQENLIGLQFDAWVFILELNGKDTHNHSHVFTV